MNKEANPILAEARLHFHVEGAAIEAIFDEAVYVRDILRAIGSDHSVWIAGDFGDTSSIDRDNDTYRALEDMLNCCATPGDLHDAIEALDFLISLRPA